MLSRLAAVSGAALFLACGSNPVCEGHGDLDWAAGQVVVGFSSSIESEQDVAEFLHARGLAVTDFLTHDPRMVALVATASGEECAWVVKLNREDSVEYAQLRYLFPLR